jgi:hypothetical protein
MSLFNIFNIFDLGDNRYTAQVVPECYPHERQPALKNWSEEEREAFCGGYSKQRRYDLRSSLFARHILLRHGRV